MSKNFLDGLDSDLKKSLLTQLKVLWAHTSTALEGNSLTLGETQHVLLEGLTIQGKPLKDHNEVVGHARAEELIEELIQKNQLFYLEHLFGLHKAVQTQIESDVYNPVGAFKREPNSTVVVIDEKQVVNDTYAKPEDVPFLMKIWCDELNKRKDSVKNKDEALVHYTWLHAGFVRIHPFSDGNGRLARLVANIPVLANGYPPIIIPREKRMDYIRLLGAWQISLGQVGRNQDLVIENKAYEDFFSFCQKSWESTWEIVGQVHEIQKKRS